MSYDEKAGRYEQRWQEYLKHTHDQLLSVFESNGHERILDLSAGTGLFAQHLLESTWDFKSLVLNDTSTEMLKIARQRLGDDERLTFTISPAEALVHPTNHFEVVLCLNAFHHYENHEKAMSEITRVLKPGGTFYVLDWNNSGYFKLLNAFIKHWVSEPIHTCSTTQMREMLHSHNFDISYSKEWRFRYWKLFLFKARK